MRKTIIAFTVLFLCLIGIAPANGAEPMDAIREPIEQGLALVNDPTYHAPEKQEELRGKIWDMVKDSFDFEAISMRALGRNWRDFSPSQRKEFTTAFTELLKNTYLNSVEGQERRERVEFLEEEKITENRAVVRTRLHAGETEIPIDYSLLARDGKWRVYDVNIEGVGMVQNYRTQFAEILAKESPDALIARIRDRNIKNWEGREQGRRETASPADG